ncbi:MAG: PEP-CTERM sorting domain-containing protein [Pseudomonadota bacterium]
MTHQLTRVALAAALTVGSASASAALIYDWSRGAGVFGGNSGLSYESLSSSYNTVTQDFTFEVEFGEETATGGWLVVSPGANPKRSNEELAIVYFDEASQDAWVYAYNGLNNSASWSQGPLLGFFENAYTTESGTATLMLNAAGIHAGLDSGFAFGPDIGIWYHPSTSLTLVGDNAGLTQFTPHNQGWYDTSFDGDCSNPRTGCITERTAVPEPASVYLIALGAGVLALRRRFSVRA